MYESDIIYYISSVSHRPFLVVGFLFCMGLYSFPRQNMCKLAHPPVCSHKYIYIFICLWNFVRLDVGQICCAIRISPA